MYTINHTATTIEVKNSKKTVFAKICLNQGASLQELQLSGHRLIKDLAPLEYKNTYASSVLFPFANRINDGYYTFKEQPFQLPINEEGNNNAIHGLIFNKTFEVLEETKTETTASIKLQYKEENKSAGFPYTYAIQLEYTFTENSLNLEVTVINTDSKTKLHLSDIVS